MSNHPSALMSLPQAHIVWNEARNEGVIFVDQEASAWPLSAADDAHQASSGQSRQPGLGSALAEAFYESYEEDGYRPVQVVPMSVFAPVAGVKGDVDLDLYDLKVQLGIAWTLRQVGEQLGAKDWAGGDGSESVEGDVGAEISNIMRAAGLVDANGEPLHRDTYRTPSREPEGGVS